MAWEEKSAALLRRKFENRAFSTADAYRVLKDRSRVIGGYSIGSIHHLLYVLCKNESLVRLGRGLYTFPPISPSTNRTLSESVKISDSVVVELIPGKLADATRILKAKGIEFMVTGPSALAKFHHYVARRLLHLIYVISGSGEATVEALKEEGLRALLNPNLRDTELALANFPEADLFIIREFSALDGNRDGKALIERALVDSYFESTRRLIPFPQEEVARIFVNVFRNEPISLTKLTRFGRRRGIAIEMWAIFNAIKIRTGKSVQIPAYPAAPFASFLSHVKNETVQ
jgi:hypothetical protein